MFDNPKTPPTFSSSKYKAWKTRVKLWEKFTEVEPKKRAFVLASTCVTEIPDIIDNLLRTQDENLSKEGGVDVLISHLDEYFSKSTELETFDRFVELMNTKRSVDQPLSEFVSIFRTRFDSISVENINLQSMCSMLLLANGQFTSQESALIKSILLKDDSLADLKVESTCQTVKMLLVDSTSMGSESVVKSESVNWTKGYGKGSFGKPWNSNRFGQSHGKHGKGKGKHKKGYSDNRYGDNRQFSGNYGKGSHNQNQHSSSSSYQSRDSKGSGKGYYSSGNYGSGFHYGNSVSVSKSDASQNTDI